MKKIILAAIMIVAFSCTPKPENLEYDATPIYLNDTVNIAPGDMYWQQIYVPTRKLKAEVRITNDSDTAKHFIVNVKETK